HAERIGSALEAREEDWVVEAPHQDQPSISHASADDRQRLDERVLALSRDEIRDRADEQRALRSLEPRMIGQLRRQGSAVELGSRCRQDRGLAADSRETTLEVI